jgi:hypothetical protein
METTEQRFLNHIHYILIQRWDPIGVHDEPYAQDEYDDYIPGIVGLLTSQADPIVVAQHLVAIEIDWMGLPGNLDHAIQTAQELSTAYQLHHPPMELSCYARVRLVTDRYRDEHAPCGSVGFIIEMYSPDAFEVECSRVDGTTYAQIVVHPNEIILDEPLIE